MAEQALSVSPIVRHLSPNSGSPSELQIALDTSGTSEMSVRTQKRAHSSGESTESTPINEGKKTKCEGDSPPCNKKCRARREIRFDGSALTPLPVANTTQDNASELGPAGSNPPNQGQSNTLELAGSNPPNQDQSNTALGPAGSNPPKQALEQKGGEGKERQARVSVGDNSVFELVAIEKDKGKGDGTDNERGAREDRKKRASGIEGCRGDEGEDITFQGEEGGDGYKPASDHRGKDKRREARKNKQNNRTTRGAFRSQPQKDFKPVYVDHPVLIEEVGGRGEQINKLGMNRKAVLIAEAAGDSVVSLKWLPSGKWLVGCKNKGQQTKLSQTKKIGNIPVKCRIPAPTVEGVVKGVAMNDADWDYFSERMKKKENVAYFHRLKNRKGEETTAVKVVFNEVTLPTELNVGLFDFIVDAFIPQVRRCSNCQKLGHIKKFCRNTQHVCARCGQVGHGGEGCRLAPRCVNCHGNHAASDRQCPEFLLWKKAAEVRASNYMPFSKALSLARQEKEQIDREENSSPPQNRPYERAWRTAPKRVDISPQTTKGEKEGKLPMQKQVAPKMKENLGGKQKRNRETAHKQLHHGAVLADDEIQETEKNDPTPAEAYIEEGGKKREERMRERKGRVEEHKEKERVKGGERGQEKAKDKQPARQPMPPVIGDGNLQEVPVRIEKEGPATLVFDLDTERVVDMVVGQDARYKQRGYRTLKAIMDFRKDQNTDTLLREIFFPDPPPPRTQLLEIMLIAGGLVAGKTDDFNELPIF